MNIVEEIKKLKREKGAVILAHYYTLPEVQDIADCKGDSLNLSRYAQNTDAEVIVFAGVHFMAETAKILNPDKRVFIPDMASHCSLADSCPADEFRAFRESHPDHKVISYINCSAEVKALSDVICTSGNAEKVVGSFSKDERLIFAPDRNLGGYLSKKLGREMLLWDGGCHVHYQLDEDDYFEVREKYPDAAFIAHPECRESLLRHAEFVGSTTALINYVEKSGNKTFIIATEEGVLHEMGKRTSGKQLVILKKKRNPGSCCAYMKKNSLEKIYACLHDEVNELFMDTELMEKARKPILRMLSIS